MRDPRFFRRETTTSAGRRSAARLRSASRRRTVTPRTAIRNVRNFWIELDVDGRSPIGTGPASRDGGFELSIKMRDEGSVKNAATIVGDVTAAGELELRIATDQGITKVRTQR